MNSVLVVGQFPPPVTGESLCCIKLIETLSKLGYDVKAVSKYESFTLRINRQVPSWHFIGSTFLGFWRDVLGLLTRRSSLRFVYLHNQSWKRFISAASFLKPLLGPNVYFVVLTNQIEMVFSSCGWTAFVLRNTIDEALLAQVRPQSHKKRILWMAAVTEAKGFLSAYKCFSWLQERDPEWQMDVFGLGLRSEDFPRANFFGLVQGEAKKRAFEGGGLLLLPSSYKNETQPLCLLEAMSIGIPVVASRVGGIPEIVGDGGLLTTDFSPASLGSLVLEIIDEYAKFSAAASSRYARMFSEANFSSTLERIMTDASNAYLIDRSANPPSR